MLQELKPAILTTIVFTLLTGVIYPLAVTGLSQVLFSDKANGSLVQANGKVSGSSLIGQNFAKPEYFHPRPSNAGAGYDGGNSSGSNLGPTNPVLGKKLKDAADAYRKENATFTGGIPSDAITMSASGLDPHISPANAEAQIGRVATARKKTPSEIRSLLAQHVEGRQLGILGEPRVNVLALNMALDGVKP